MRVSIEGDEKLLRSIKSMENASKVFDKDFMTAAAQSSGRLVRTTPRKTGNTARGWATPKRLGDSFYEVVNKIVAIDGLTPIAKVLDSGRGVVYPKKAKRLYIPLSEKGRSKRSGANIPEDFVYGEDYILAKSARAYPGTKYIEKELDIASKDLSDRLIARVRSVHG